MDNRHSFQMPPDLAQALHAMSSGPDATLLAGGQVLVAQMNAGRRAPRRIVSLRAIDPLRDLRSDTDGAVEIGAMVTWDRLTRLDAEAGAGTAARLIAATARTTAHPAIRAAATLGGTLALADPLADMPVALVALDAQVRIAGAGASGIVTREVPCETFVQQMAQKGGAGRLQPHEIIVAAEIPAWRPEGADSIGVHYEKLNRVDHDYALLSVAACLAFRRGRCVAASLALGGAGSSSLRARDAERVLIGAAPGPAAFAEAASLAAAAANPRDDIKATARYRARVLPGLIRRALESAAARALPIHPEPRRTTA